MKIQAPENLIMELPGRETGCPFHCKHCIHMNVQPSLYPNLSHHEIIKILKWGRNLGI